MEFDKDNWFRFVVIFIILFAVVFFLMPQNASASWIGSLFTGVLEVFAKILKAVGAIVEFITNLTPQGIMDMITGLILIAINFFFDAMKALLTESPTVYCGPSSGSSCQQNSVVRAIAPTILSIIQPFYVTMALFTGMYLIFAAIDPKRRSIAKNMLMKVLVGMVIVSLSLPIYQFTLDLSASLTRLVFSEAYAQFAGQSGRTMAMLGVIVAMAIILYPPLLSMILWVGLFILVAVVVVMSIRYVAVVIFAILFPISLFLYFFDSTKSLGGSILYQALSWIFVPVVQALMIVITFFAIEGIMGSVMPADANAMKATTQSMPPPTSGSASPATLVLMFFMAIGGLLGILLAPLIMLSVLKWVGGAVAGYGMLKIPQAETKQDFYEAAGLAALGGSMMGGISQGLPFAANQAAYMGENAPVFRNLEGMRGSLSAGDVLPSFGELKDLLPGSKWRGRTVGSRERSASGNDSYDGPRSRGGRVKKGFVRDFFESYTDALTQDKRYPMDVINRTEEDRNRDKALFDKSSGRPMPLSPASTLAGSGQDKMNQYTTVSQDGYGARDVYMPKIEGAPFLSIPMFFLGGMWGQSMSNRSKDAGKYFKDGHVFKGVGVSMFETFKIFSPFRPIRHLGRILFTAIPEFVPPIPFPVPFVGWNLRDAALAGSRKLSGIGFGQMATRMSWTAKMAMCEGEFNEAKKRWDKSGGTSTADAVKMQEAAEKWSKLQGEIQEGKGMRGMNDPEFANRKLQNLFNSNRDFYKAVVKSARAKSMATDDYGVMDAASEIADAEKKGLDRKAFKSSLEKKIADEPDEKKKGVLTEEMGMKLLLYDYLKQKTSEAGSPYHGKTLKQAAEIFIANGMADQDKKEVTDFMQYNGARQFRVGVSEKGDEVKGTWSEESYDFKKMKEYIDRHKSVMGVDLVVREKNGSYRRSKYRVVEKSSRQCAFLNEMLKTGDGRSLTNVNIMDFKEGDQAYSVVDEDSSQYVERMARYESGGGNQFIYGKDDFRTEQGLDAGMWVKDPAGRRVLQDTGVGFMDHFSYRQTQEGGMSVFYKGHAVGDLSGRELQEVSELTGVSREDIKRGKLTRDHALLTAKNNPNAFYEAVSRQQQLGMTSSEAQELLDKFNKGELSAERVEAVKKKSYEDSRSSAIAQDQTDVNAYIASRYGTSGAPKSAHIPTYSGYQEYAEDLKKASQHIYFSGEMVRSLRDRGYDDREIDHLKLTLYHDPRYQKLIQNGESIDIRIACNEKRREAAWVTTDEAGRRTLTLNIAGESVDQVRAARTRVANIEDRLGRPDLTDTERKRLWADLEKARDDESKVLLQTREQFMDHVENGDILGHETTHDVIREKFGDASYEDIWRDFTAGGTSAKMNGVLTNMDLVRADVAASLGLSVAQLSDKKRVKAALKAKGLNEEQMGRMLCEGLSDVGGRQQAGGSKPRAAGDGYDQSIDHWAETSTEDVLKRVKAQKAANIKPGEVGFLWVWSDVGIADISEIARIQAIADNPTYITDAVTRARTAARAKKVRDEIQNAGGTALVKKYDEMVKIHKDMMRRAAIKY